MFTQILNLRVYVPLVHFTLTKKKGTSNFSMNKERANNYSFTQKIHMLALKIRNHSSSKTKQVSIITYLSLNSSIIWTLGFVVNSKINF
jgi:hypothetical protein